MAKTAAATAGEYLPKVKSQYEQYPYPPFDPEKERAGMTASYMDSLLQISHCCYSGRKDWSKEKPRALVAGGGTGTSTICLAEQFRQFGGEVVYVDLSEASMAITKRRAEIRGLDNITFHLASLLEIPKMKLGAFDYINCTGVLHHLADPDAGLASLRSVLKDDGAMGLMVYAPYGREGIYQVQRLMRILCEKNEDDESRVKLCRKTVEGLPQWHPLGRSVPIMAEYKASDIGLYDLFLHSQDRAYSVDEVYDFLERQGLHLAAFTDGCSAHHPSMNIHGAAIYDPSFLIRDREVLERVMTLPQRERYAVAELVHGQILMHSFYATPFEPPAPPAIDEAERLVPTLAAVFSDNEHLRMAEAFEKTPEGQVLKIGQGMQQVGVHASGLLAAILHYMDGERTLKEIYQAVMKSMKYKKLKPTYPRLEQEFALLYQLLRPYHWLLFRDRKTPGLASYHHVQRQMYDRMGYPIPGDQAGPTKG